MRKYKPQITLQKKNHRTGFGPSLSEYSDGKSSAYNAGDLGSIPELGRSPGEGYGNPFQYSCLKNSTDRRA